MVDANHYMLPENSFRFEQLQLQLVEDVNGIPWISAVADFNGRCFTHCHYVSLRREKKIGTLFIRDLNEKKNNHFDAIVEEMQRL